MRRLVAVVVGAGVVLAGGALRAEEHPEMRAAQRELQAARGHLLAAAKEYEGHRRAAIAHVDEALQEIKAGLTAAKARRGKAEKREQGGERPQAD
ncbi:MAG TPA: hypothetical protein VFD84_20360 [Candidatus Binatia bacterium]|nr:hypothetical protein [Candidatus Binatia bacterium]